MLASVCVRMTPYPYRATTSSNFRMTPILIESLNSYVKMSFQATQRVHVASPKARSTLCSRVALALSRLPDHHQLSPTEHSRSGVIHDPLGMGTNEPRPTRNGALQAVLLAVHLGAKLHEPRLLVQCLFQCMDLLANVLATRAIGFGELVQQRHICKCECPPQQVHRV